MNQLPIDNGYLSFSETFEFREIGSIYLPKSIREEAFQMEVSVEVVSILHEDYSNYKSYPSNSFYGYAVLVFYDYVTRLVPLSFGRNTIYFERNESAYSDWESFKYLCWNAYNLGLIAEMICAIATQLGGECVPMPCNEIPYNGFTELPLREVYVKCPYGTQFRIETAIEKANAFQDACGNVIQPKSNRPDDDKKDKGLPPQGIKPQKSNDPTYPYAGLPSPSSPSDLGDWDNSGKLPDPRYPQTSGIDKPNSNNTPDPTGTIYWLKVVARAKTSGTALYPCVKTRVNTYYFQLLDNTIRASVAPYGSPQPSGCGDGKYAQAYGVTLSGGDGSILTAPNSTEGGIDISYGSGTTLPANTETYE